MFSYVVFFVLAAFCEDERYYLSDFVNWLIPDRDEDYNTTYVLTYHLCTIIGFVGGRQHETVPVVESKRVQRRFVYAGEIVNDSPVKNDEDFNSPLRPGIALIAAVVWNIPLAVLLILAINGTISVDSIGFFAGLWSFAIPLVAILTAYVKPVQSIVFVSDFDVRPYRLRFWLLACFWIGIGAMLFKFGF